VHPFWSSHKEKQACVRLSMRGSHGRSWSFHGPAMGSSPEGKGKGERGEEAGAHCWGAREAGASGWLPTASLLPLCVRRNVHVRKKRRRKERRKRKRRKEKRKKEKNMNFFFKLENFQGEK
jgi:hypothetical protein